MCVCVQVCVSEREWTSLHQFIKSFFVIVCMYASCLVLCVFFVVLSLLLLSACTYTHDQSCKCVCMLNVMNVMHVKVN